MTRPVALALAVLSAVVLSTPRTSAAAGRAAAGGQAAGQRQQPDMKAMMERNKRCAREASAHAAKVTFDRKDLERYLAEYRSFDALGIEREANEGEKCFDLPAALKDPRYVAWTRERRLEPKDFLLKSLRISLTHAKRRAPEQAAQMKAQMETQRRELTKSCTSMGPNACRDMEKAFAQGDEMMRESTAMMALFPDPTRAEAALLAEYDAKLREATEGARRGRDGEGERAPDEATEADGADAPPAEDRQR